MAMGHQLERRALVIVAHPDDAEFGAAGTVATWVREGWEVRYVIVSDGSAGGGDDATDVGPAARRQVSATRQAEQRAAGEVLGLAGIDFLNYPDGQIQHTIELRRELVRRLRTYRPSRVIMLAPTRIWEPSYRIGLYHPDHIAVSDAAIGAIYPASQNPWDFPELLMEEGLAPHTVNEVWFVAAPNVNRWVDVSDVMDVKLDALRAHASQLARNFDEVEHWVRQWMGEAGQRHGVAYAEEFHVAENGIPQAPEVDADAELAAAP
jgi:LmbE family N-acetylglucosaminyl deacetylase